MRHQCILHCPLDTAHRGDEPTSALPEPHRVPHQPTKGTRRRRWWWWVNTYVLCGGTMYKLAARSLAHSRTRALRSRQAGNSSSLCLCPPRCLLLSSASFGLYIQWQAIRYAHFLYKYIRLCVCLYVFIYLFMCVFVYLSVCVRSCDLFW